MSPAPNTSVFLERASYRQRRLRDAARLLPLLGAVLWVIPLLWARAPRSSGSADAIIYTFGVWVFLILVSAVISRRLRPDDPVPPEGAPD
ncbi:hypothetical protein [Yoonia sp.]|jgi:hypothetical protein|uniref:hypothetical protein n=1 Tax=Yoonia sp. TaxID=2212373 RepID=UPI003F6B2745